MQYILISALITSLTLCISPDICISGTATTFWMKPVPISVMVGASFELPAIVAKDDEGNVDTGYHGTHTISYSGALPGPLRGTPSFTTEVFFDHGTSTTPLLTTLVCAGTTTLTITDEWGLSGTYSPITVTPGTPDAFTITTQHNQNEYAGCTFSVTVKAIDIYGNIATSYEGDRYINCTCTATVAPDNQTYPLIPASGTFLFIKGETIIPGFILVNANEQPVIYIDDGLISGSSLPVIVNPGTPSSFSIVTEHQNIETAGVEFYTTLQMIDPYHNIVDTYTGTLTISWQTNANCSPDGTEPQLPETQVCKFINGKVIVDGFVLVNSQETPVLIAHGDSPLISGTSSPITVNSSYATGFVLTPPEMVIAGQTFVLGTITAIDTFGNTATTYSGTKTLIYSGPNNGPVTGTPAYTTEVFFDRGMSTTDLFTTLVCAEITRIHIQTDNIVGTSTEINVVPGNANYFELITQHNGTETAGATFSVNIIARDIFGNLATSYEGKHYLNWLWDAEVSPEGIPPVKPEDGYYEFHNGTATVAGFMLTNAVPTIIYVSEAGITGNTSPINVLPGNVDHIRITTEHNFCEIAGVPFSVTLTGCDLWGNANTEFMGTYFITWTWDATPSPAGVLPVLPPNGSYTFKSGEVTIDGFMLTNVADTPIIYVQCDNWLKGTSTSISIIPGKPVNFGIIAPEEVNVEVAFDIISITAYDYCGNIAITYHGNMNLIYSGPGVSPTGIEPSYTSPVYFEEGKAVTRLTTTLTKVETVRIHVVDEDNNVSGYSNEIKVNPSKISYFEVITQHQNVEIAGENFSVILKVKDVYGNIVDTYTGSHYITWSWTASNSPNNIPPHKPADGELWFDNGICEVTGFVLTCANEFPTITATEGTLTGTSQQITVKPNRAKTFEIRLPDKVTAGATITITSITAFDAYGNIAVEYQGTKTLSYSGPGSAPLTGQMPVFPPAEVFFSNGVAAQVLKMQFVRAEKTRLQVQQGDISGYSNEIIVLSAEPGCFLLFSEHNNQEVAGATFSVTVIAKDRYGNDVSEYEDLHPLAWHWNATKSPDNIPPILPPDGNQKFICGITTVDGFVLTNATNTCISVTDGIISGSVNIKVIPAEPIYFDISLPTPVTVHHPFEIDRLIAKDAYGNIATGYSGTKTLIFSGPGTDTFGNKPYYTNIVVFDQGIPITPLIIELVKPEKVAVNVRDGIISGTSTPIEVIALEAVCMAYPHEVYSGGTRTIEYTVTNINECDIKEIRITIPGGFSYIDAGVPVVSNENKMWSADGGEGYVILTPNNLGDYLSNGEWIKVNIVVITQDDEQAPTPWTAIVTGKHGASVMAHEMCDGDAEVAITAYRLNCNVSTHVVLPGGAATVTAQVIYYPTNSPYVGGTVSFKVIEGDASIPAGNIAYTNDKGIAYVNVIAGDTCGTVTVEVRYRLFNIRKVMFNVVAPVPEIVPGIHGIIKENVIYAKQDTIFKLKEFEGFYCEYKIDDGTWERFYEPFVIHTPGKHTVYYRYVDASGYPGMTSAYTVYITPVYADKLINYPNPFNPYEEDTIIEYYLYEPAKVSIKIYDLSGRIVWEKDIPAVSSGIQQEKWNGRNGEGYIVGNGGYICQVTIKYGTGNRILTRKIGVVK